MKFEVFQIVGETDGPSVIHLLDKLPSRWKKFNKTLIGENVDSPIFCSVSSIIGDLLTY